MKSIKTNVVEKFITSLVAAFVLFTANAQAQSVSATPCEVKITSIKEGEHVGPSATIGGTATLPLEGYLWLFARKTSMGNQWWPQAGGAIVPDGKTSAWKAEVFFGVPSDIGSNFDVSAVVVNQQTDKDLTQWFSTAQQRGYPPVRFPDSISSCRIVSVTVTKAK